MKPPVQFDQNVHVPPSDGNLVEYLYSSYK